MGSMRLPGKSMMDLAGAPLVGRILDRVKRCSTLDEIVLAIPSRRDDEVLRKLGEDYGIKVFSGSENDLLERYYEAAKFFAADIVVRLPADNPVPEPAEIDRIVDHHLSLGRRGFSSNLAEILNSGYPDGIGAEVFDYSLLEEAHESQKDEYRREHVHLNFYDYQTGHEVDPKWCPVSTVPCPKGFRRPELVLDVNTFEQYQFMRALYEDLYPQNHEFHIMDIVRWFDEVYSRT